MSVRISSTRSGEYGPQAAGDLRRLLIQATPRQAKHVMARSGELQVPGAIALERVTCPVVLPPIELDHERTSWPAGIDFEPSDEGVEAG